MVLEDVSDFTVGYSVVISAYIKGNSGSNNSQEELGTYLTGSNKETYKIHSEINVIKN